MSKVPGGFFSCRMGQEPGPVLPSGSVLDVPPHVIRVYLQERVEAAMLAVTDSCSSNVTPRLMQSESG